MRTYAAFDQPDASIMDINYTSGRRLNKELIKRLATCEYIAEHGIFSSPVQQAVGRLTWPVPLAWRHVNSISTPGMSPARPAH